MSLAHICRRAAGPLARHSFNIPSPTLAACRLYSSRTKNAKDATKTKNKHDPVSTDTLIPGSKLRISEDARAEYITCEDKMKPVVEWFRKEMATYENRALGRVTPALLSGVRVMLPDRGSDPLPLEEVATVGVKDGSTLIVTMFEDNSLKHVEAALYDSKIPGVVPQRADARTIRIPIPKPTVEARTTLLAIAQREAETTRVHLRRVHQGSIKRGKYGKHSTEYDEFQKLADKYIGEVDKILANMRKNAK